MSNTKKTQITASFVHNCCHHPFCNHPHPPYLPPPTKGNLSLAKLSSQAIHPPPPIDFLWGCLTFIRLIQTELPNIYKHSIKTSTSWMNVRFGHQHWMHSIAPKSSYQCFTKIFVTWWTYGHNSNNNNDDEVCRRVHSSSGAVLMQTGVEEAKRAVSLWVDPASQLRAQKCSQFCFHWSQSFQDIWSDVNFSCLFQFVNTLFSPFLFLFFPFKSVIETAKTM